MDFQLLTYQTKNRIATVTINRPEKRNALNAELIAELHNAIGAAQDDNVVRVIVLTGQGDTFCAGADLQYLQNIAAHPPLENAADSTRLMEMLYAWKTCSKPTIAMVNGSAIAGGCGLALTCDIILSSDQATFGFTEVRIGFVPAIVARLLIDRIGKGRGLELLLRGMIIDAQDAKSRGMVNEIVSKQDLLRRVDEVANEIVSSTSPTAIKLTKQLLREIDMMDLEHAMCHAAVCNTFSRTTNDFQRGVSSFINKEKIVW